MLEKFYISQEIYILRAHPRREIFLILYGSRFQFNYIQRETNGLSTLFVIQLCLLLKTSDISRSFA